MLRDQRGACDGSGGSDETSAGAGVARSAERRECTAGEPGRDGLNERIPGKQIHLRGGADATGPASGNQRTHWLGRRPKRMLNSTPPGDEIE